jgi:hypothetical protein
MSGRRAMGMLIICLVACVGCEDKNSVPGGILPRDKMEQLMWDMAQADQYAALYLAKDSGHIDRKAETMRLYEEVFRLHQVTPEQFRKSYHYYLDHPVLSQLLFDSVSGRGVRARSEMYDRPSLPYRPPVGPGGANVPVRPVVGVPVSPGNVRPGVMPGLPQNSGQSDMARRFREAAARRQDSIMRAMHVRRDTTKERP